MNESSISLLDQVSKIGVVKKSRTSCLARFKAEAAKIREYPDAGCRDQIMTAAAVACVVLARNLGTTVAGVLRVMEDQNSNSVRFRINFAAEATALKAFASTGNYWDFVQTTHRIIDCQDTFAANASTRILPPASQARPKVIPLP